MAGYSLTAEQADALLHHLATDDGFRALFTEDLPAAFQQLPGKPVAPKGVPGDCLRPRKLASREAIAAAREALFTTFTRELGLIPHLLEA